MEDTLRDKDFISCMISPTAVLILVLMEDTLRDVDKEGYVNYFAVLILVLMEDTLRELIF